MHVYSFRIFLSLEAFKAPDDFFTSKVVPSGLDRWTSYIERAHLTGFMCFS